jgi:sigma-B regulation protein RsbU (phosphoserine phosphatase)
VINVRTGEIQYSNGGHNSPYLVKSSGEVSQIPSTDGFIVGKIPNTDFETKKVQLQKGETLFLYTDGVTEAMDADMNLYEESRLVSYLQGTSGSSIKEVIDGSLLDVKKYANGAPQSDDITVLAIRFLGNHVA